MTKLKLVTAASLVCLLSACGGSIESIAAGLVADGDCIGDNCDDNQQNSGSGSGSGSGSNDGGTNVSNGTYTFSDTVALVSVASGGNQNNRAIASTTDYSGSADLNITVTVADSGTAASGSLDVIDDAALTATATGINITEVAVAGPTMTTALTGSVNVQGTEVTLGTDSFIYAEAVTDNSGNFTNVTGDDDANTVDILLDLGDNDIGVYGYDAVAD